MGTPERTYPYCARLHHSDLLRQALSSISTIYCDGAAFEASESKTPAFRKAIVEAKMAAGVYGTAKLRQLTQRRSSSWIVKSRLSGFSFLQDSLSCCEVVRPLERRFASICWQQPRHIFQRAVFSLALVVIDDKGASLGSENTLSGNALRSGNSQRRLKRDLSIGCDIVNRLSKKTGA